MPLIEDYLEDVTPGLVIVPDSLDAAIKTALDREIAKWPDAEKDRDLIRGQLISFFSVHGYLPEFTLEPRDPPCEEYADNGPTDPWETSGPNS